MYCIQQKGNNVLSSFVNVCFVVCYVFGFVQRYVDSKIKVYVLCTILYGVQILRCTLKCGMLF